MKESRDRKRSKKRGKSKNKEFMDAALDAFIRDQSLKKWNEVEGLRSGAEIESLEAIKSSSNFIEKGQYFNIWKSWWENDVIKDHSEKKEHLFAKIENAVRGAVLEERELRKKNPISYWKIVLNTRSLFQGRWSICFMKQEEILRNKYIEKSLW